MAAQHVLRTSIAALLAAASAACAPSISSERDESVPVPQGATWAWTARDTTAPWERDPALGSAILHQRFQRAIEVTMRAKGFLQVEDASEADFLLSYHVGATLPRVAAATGIAVGWYGGWGWGWGWPRRGYWGWPGWGWGWYGPPMWGGVVLAPHPVPFGGGALIVVLRERSTGDVAWEGSCTFEPYGMRRATQKRVQAVVNDLFEDLP